MKSAVLVLGGYVNGYSIIRELYDYSKSDIILFDDKRSLATFSNKIKFYSIIKWEKNLLLNEIRKLHLEYEYIVIFPTDDLQLELLLDIYSDIKDYCFCPFNHHNLKESLNKFVQYSYCEELGVPYPKSVNINSIDDYEKVNSIKLPVIIKPSKREDLKQEVFRSLKIESEFDIKSSEKKIKDLLDKGMSFIASEVIPGDSSNNIFAYTAYRNKKGHILNEWIGRKVTQYPDDYGVMSTTSNEAPEIIKEQGRKLLNGMDLMGICEPEFKYDYRDHKYKLMEINLRSMMWNRVGNLSSVYLQYSQYLDALNVEVPKFKQTQDEQIKFVYFKHELANLIYRKNYFSHFKENVFNTKKRNFAIFEIKDFKPFLWDILSTVKVVLNSCLKRLKVK